jgi:hypothetical protein
LAIKGSLLGLSVRDPSDAHVETTTLPPAKAKGFVDDGDV